LAVGRADRSIEVQRPAPHSFESAVVGKTPGTPPQLAHERMGIFQRNLPPGSLADVRDDRTAFDRQLAQQLRELRLSARQGISKQPVPLALIEDHAPAVTMRTGP